MTSVTVTAIAIFAIVCFAFVAKHGILYIELFSAPTAYHMISMCVEEKIIQNLAFKANR